MAPINNIVTAIGDSITLASAAGTGGKTSAAIVSGYSKYQAQTVNGTGVGGYLTWTTILPKTGDTSSNGPILWGGVHATSGQNTATIITTHVDGNDSPFNDSPKPGTCVIMCGANDCGEGAIQTGGTVNPTTLATWVSNMTYIANKVASRGIMPILLKVTPNSTANNQIAITAMNSALVTLCAARGWTLVDTFTPVATGTNWTANYNVDTNHPSVTGAVAMGQAIRDALEPLMPSSRPTLVTTVTEGDSIYQWMNGAFQREGAAPVGVPRGGAPAVEDTNPWTFTAASATPTLGARSGYNGQAWRVLKATNVADTTAISAGGAGVPPQYADADNFAVGFIAEIAVWEASCGLNFEFYQQSNSTNKMARLKLATDANYTTAVKPFVWWQTNTIPASFSSNLRISLAWGQGGTRVIDAYLGQLSIVKPV